MTSQRSRDLVLVNAVGAILVMAVAMPVIAGCGASSLLAGSRALQVGGKTVRIPVVSDPAVQAQIEAFAAEMEAQAERWRRERDAAVARGDEPPPEPKLGLEQILATLVTGGVTGLGAWAAAKKSAASKDEAMLQPFAAALASLLAIPSEKRTPELIATTLTEALPGAATLAVGDVKKAA